MLEACVCVGTIAFERMTFDSYFALLIHFDAIWVKFKGQGHKSETATTGKCFFTCTHYASAVYPVIFPVSVYPSVTSRSSNKT